MGGPRSWRRNQNRNRIDMKNPEDVRLWMMALGVTEGELREAIEAAGESADKVREYLEMRH